MKEGNLQRTKNFKMNMSSSQFSRSFQKIEIIPKKRKKRKPVGALTYYPVPNLLPYTLVFAVVAP
jgi:hypothetical protein